MSSYDTVPDYARHNDKEVCGFFGQYRFLSNFYLTNIYYGGFVFRSTEHAFQFAKVDKKHLSDAEVRELADAVNHFKTNEVKAWGRAIGTESCFETFETLRLRADWESVKYDIMMAVVFDKFFRNRELRAKLLQTGDRYLEETNNWKDKIWGIYSGQGTNWLGKILMRVRDAWKPI